MFIIYYILFTILCIYETILYIYIYYISFYGWEALELFGPHG